MLVLLRKAVMLHKAPWSAISRAGLVVLALLSLPVIINGYGGKALAACAGPKASLRNSAPSDNAWLQNVSQAQDRVPAPHKPAILVTAVGSPGIFLIDPVLEHRLRAAGYRVASLYADQLTSQNLKLFDLVVVVHEDLDANRGHSGASRSEALERLKSTDKLLLSYVRQGGSLLTFFDERHYTRKWNFQINMLLSPFGATMTREQYQEHNNADIYVLPMHHSAVYRTDNITASPITRGVRQLWYPGGHWDGTMHLDPAWQVLVRGSQTASTAETYKSAPPLVAVRSYGKGKVAITAFHSSFYVNNGYNQAYEGGWCFNRGDGLLLFENLFDWLGEHPAGTGLGGYHPGMVPPLAFRAKVSIENLPTQRYWKSYPGIFGVYSTFSGGAYTVEAYAAEARRQGLSFLAFTDRIRTAAQWQALVEACRRASTATFVAIPGVTFQDSHGNEGAAVNIDDWPLARGIEMTSFIQVLLNTGKEHGGIFALMQPRDGPTFPQNLGGFNAFEIFSRRDSATFSDASNWFQRLEAIPGYSLLPVVSQRVWSLKDLDQAAAGGFRLYLYAPSLSKLRATPTTGLVPGFTTNGPKIDQFYVNHMAADLWETYFLWKPGDLAHIHVRITDRVPLASIELYAGHKLIRRYQPGSRDFLAVTDYPMAEEGPFYLVVRDTQGGVAYSNAIPTRNRNYWNHYGSDRMNNYTDPFLPDQSGDVEAPDVERLGTGGEVTYGSGWGAYLRFRMPVPQGLYHPQGYETGQISEMGLGDLQTYPRLFSPATDELNQVATARDYALATHDVAIMTEDFRNVLDPDQRCSPSKFLEASASEIWFRFNYRPFGYLIGLIGTHARVIADAVPLAAGPGVKVSLLQVNYGDLGPVKYYTYIDPQGQKQTAPIDLATMQKPQVFQIGKGGYFTLWPDPYGLVALYALDSGLTVELGKEGKHVYLRAGYQLGGQVLHRGRQFAAKFIVVQEGGGQNPEVWDRLSALWGLNDTPAYAPRVLSGELEPGGYIVNLAAADGGAKVQFSDKVYNLPNDILPLRVSGVNKNWSAGALGPGMHFVPAGVYDGSLYLGLQKYAGKKLFLGNPLICDQPNVELDIDHIDAHEISYQLSNNGPVTVRATVEPAPASGIPPFVQKISLPPGKTVTLQREW